eukprot:1168973-Karenia_brevis.AAC.1
MAHRHLPEPFVPKTKGRATPAGASSSSNVPLPKEAPGPLYPPGAALARSSVIAAITSYAFPIGKSRRCHRYER